jgi:hypothetical protein
MKKRNIFFISIFFALFANSCKYDFILPEQVPVITTPPGFAAQVAPIFTTGNCTACHSTGGQAPDLTSANAYAQIVPNLINTATPENSLIYSFPGPKTSTHTWKKLTAGQAAIILAWIKDGAKNN